jgi:pimeloyl-ACP methyl ester carboxylesterase
MPPHQPVVLVGRLIGGLVAAFTASRSPQHVRELVLVETAIAPQSTKAEHDTLFALLDRDWSGTLHDIYRAFGRDSAQGDMLWREALQLPHPDMRQWIDVAVTADLTREASGLTRCPCSRRCRRARGRRTRRGRTLRPRSVITGIPHLTMVRFEDCGHFLMLDRPRELASVVRRFCAPSDSVMALR